MAKKVDLDKIVDEIAEAYNATDPDYPCGVHARSEIAHGEIELEGYEHISDEGGGEGGAEHCETVFKWKDKTYMMIYSYYSHHGFDFDYAALYEVQPQKKEITVYV